MELQFTLIINNLYKQGFLLQCIVNTTTRTRGYSIYELIGIDKQTRLPI